MDRVEGFRDRGRAARLVRRIERVASGLGRTVTLMEVCGTHTVALRRSGIHTLLPANVRLVSGPGCPVCVTPTSYVDNALGLLAERRAVVATFGDMLRVPGSSGASLARYTGDGWVRILYSPWELLRLAAEAAPRPVVFLGIGFETTIPAVARVFLAAADKGMEGLYLYSAFRAIVPALEALLASPVCSIDAFLLPGHVSAVIGARAYASLEGRIPGVIAGFEPVDLLLAILMALRQIAEGSRRVQNAYTRVVRPEGNPRAQAAIQSLLEPADDLWRGLGVIPGGAFALRSEFRSFDARARFDLAPLVERESPGCLCSRVIQGASVPADCSFFGAACTPRRPLGPCMVSSEGACAAHLRYA